METPAPVWEAEMAALSSAWSSDMEQQGLLGDQTEEGSPGRLWNSGLYGCCHLLALGRCERSWGWDLLWSDT